METSRRNLIGALAIAPLAACSAPTAATSTASEITTLCAEYNALSARLARHPLGDTLYSDPDYEAIEDNYRALCDASAIAYKSVIDAPIATVEHVALKLEILRDYHDGCVIDEDDVTKIVNQVRGMAA